MKVPLKKKREKGYYSCLDFDNLYKKKKKIQLKYSIYRDKHFSDTELFDKKKFQIKKKNGYVYKQKHFIINNKDDNKLYLFNNVAIYKNYFDKYHKKNDEKLKNIKKILKIYENVTTNEKKKLYELIKFFSFTQGGFQSNKLRQKLWLLLLGFNINLSKEKNYNENPISKLCRKQKKKFKYINSLKYSNLKWIKGEGKNKKNNKDNLRKINLLEGKKNEENTYLYNNYLFKKKKKKKKFNYMKCKEEVPNFIKNNRKIKYDSYYNDEEESSNKSLIDVKNNGITHKKEKLKIFKNNNIISLSETKDNNSYKIKKNKSLDKYKFTKNNTREDLLDFSVRSSFSKYTLSSLYASPFSSQLPSLEHSCVDSYSSTASFSSSSLSSSFSSSSNSINIRDNSESRKKKSPLHFFSSGNSFEFSLSTHNERKTIQNENSNIYDFSFSNKRNKRKKNMNNNFISEIDKKSKKSFKEKFRKIVNCLINIDEEKNKGTSNKKKNKKFIIKLLKIIYNNILEIDLYIVDYITRKDQIKSKNDIFSYLKYNIKHNYNLNSNLKKWIIDSILLDENERIQVKKDVKRSVNTWNVHKNNIYEIKKKYQYILKNIICSILYKHSNKIYYAQGVHDVCLVFITLYFHKFFLRYKKYVLLERFISKYVVNKICSLIFTKKYKNQINLDYFINYPETETKIYSRRSSLSKENSDSNTAYCNKKKLKKKKSYGDEYCEYNENNKSTSKKENFININNNNINNYNSNDNNNDNDSDDNNNNDSNGNDTNSNNNNNNNNSYVRKKKKKKLNYGIFQSIIYNMFVIEEEYIEKICVIKNINVEKYLEYKKKKEKKEYIVYLLCERFLLFYMIDYLTLSLDVSIKNTFRSIGLLLKYLDKEVYDVFCLLQKEQEYENTKNNKKYIQKSENSENSLKLNGTEFFFCLSWVVTYYSHVFTEFDKLARIFDTLLSNNGIFIIYFTGSIILYKKDELLQIANKKKKYQCYNNLYSETHYIFQNMNWKNINVENIIKKTYYYMNYKLPFNSFLKKIKKKISFPPFSPIYSYPFILHHFNYKTKQEEIKNQTVEKSILNFYKYNNERNKRNCQNDSGINSAIRCENDMHNINAKYMNNMNNFDNTLKRDNLNKANHINNDISSLGSCNSDTINSKLISDFEKKSFSFTRLYNFNISDNNIESCDEYVNNNILNENNTSELSKKNYFMFKKNKYSKDNNIYLHYPYTILCNNIEINKKIIKKHLLVENFFEYVFYDFILNYEFIFNKYNIKSKRKCYTIQYVNVKSKKDHIIEKRKKEIQRKKYEKILHKMAKNVMFLYIHQCNIQKNRKYVYFNFVTKKKNILPHSNFKNKKRNKRIIEIIPPIYKYIIENCDINKNVVSYKKIKLNTISVIKEDKKKKKFEKILYIVKTSFYNCSYVNFFLIFFLLSLISSFFYFHR
ncbi:conserved Plasmodium protein, unknown function [Plasmodium relictum]|uniref:Rab-GAP TBC domain-containing protein n=1 Tax=Plasmodium relictum TaxID=85471 RepID=A0A1J1H592_PLARL|nr:conserved Plasmodium protein, unknown function [Plasmodium relictum]CRG99723.1 conserved Plasmodium protein, unknown function [Plasmodium relictum]